MPLLAAKIAFSVKERPANLLKSAQNSPRMQSNLLIIGLGAASLGRKNM
jgi:hypothetical protein